MVGYRIQYGVPIADTISPATFWKITERCGNYSTSGKATMTIANAQRAIQNTANVMGYEIDGWVQSAARSLVAVTTNGRFMKAPIFDRKSITKGIELYSQARAGARVVQVYYDNTLFDYPVIIMEQLPGESFRNREVSEEEYQTIIDTILEVQPPHGELQQFMSLEDRIAMDSRESRQRFETIKHHIPTDEPCYEYMELIEETGAKILATEAPKVLCHGDLDLRNIIQYKGEPRFLDPEPVVAPIEFDIAKLLTMDSQLNPEIFPETDPHLSQNIALFYRAAWRLYGIVKEHFINNFKA